MTAIIIGLVSFLLGVVTHLALALMRKEDAKRKLPGPVPTHPRQEAVADANEARQQLNDEQQAREDEIRAKHANQTIDDVAADFAATVDRLRSQR